MNDKLTMFRNRLLKMYRHRSKQARRLQVSCYRVYDHDLPEFPFGIDIYEDKLYVAEYKRRHTLTEEEYESWLDESLKVMQEVLSIAPENVFLKQRQRKQGRQGQYEKVDAAKNEFIVHENGLQFRVNLSDYLDTGLFLDHRITRQMVREQSRDKHVLNLFCYTGSFSVYAAAGLAAAITSVDLSKTYLQWAKDNMQLNGFTNPRQNTFLSEDVLQFLAAPRNERFDLVVLDPPTFSNSKRMKDFLEIQRDHVMLINQCLHMMKPGGLLYFSTNFSKFRLETAQIKAASIRDITRQTTPFDFEGKLARWCFLVMK
ncbi:MAG TPA: class I SAM-dependent methyltransferase [Chitinophagaceae bacterium]|nr:class I SAM-dependent methyltransferase [Chitinophagaceae bacterium]